MTDEPDYICRTLAAVSRAYSKTIRRELETEAKNGIIEPQFDECQNMSKLICHGDRFEDFDK